MDIPIYYKTSKEYSETFFGLYKNECELAK